MLAGRQRPQEPKLPLDDGLDLRALLGEDVAHELADVARAVGRGRGVAQVRAQLGLEVRGARVTIPRAVRGRFEDDALEPRIDVGVGVARPRDVAVHERVEDLQIVRAAAPHAVPDRGLPEHRAHGEDVGAAIQRLAGGLLGSHVGDLALEHPGARVVRRVERLRDAEVEDLDQPVVGDQHVLRAHVPVNEAHGRAVEVGDAVGVLQALEELHDHVELEMLREHHRGPASSRHDAVERLPVEVLHRDEVLAAIAAHLDRLHHVGVVQLGGEARLLEEHEDELRVLGHVLLEDLHHEELVEPARTSNEREVDDAHPAARELRDQAVAPDVHDLVARDWQIGMGVVGGQACLSSTIAQNIGRNRYRPQMFPNCHAGLLVHCATTCRPPKGRRGNAQLVTSTRR